MRKNSRFDAIIDGILTSHAGIPPKAGIGKASHPSIDRRLNFSSDWSGWRDHLSLEMVFQVQEERF
jgi:hypothetical protein